MPPKNQNIRKKTQQVNMPWVRNALRSIGISTGNAFKEISPNISEVGSFGLDTSKKVIDGLRRGRTGSGRVSENIKRNKYVQIASKAYKNALSDLRSGNFYNDDRMFGSLGGGDEDMGDLFNFEDTGADSSFSFGDEDTAQTTNNINVNYGASQGAILEMREATTRQTEAILETNKASMDAMVAITSNQMMQTQQIGAEIVSHLTNIESSLTAMVEYNNENVSKYIEASMAFMEKVGGGSKKNSGPDIESDSVFNLNGGLNVNAYKKHIKKQFKNAIANNPNLSQLSMIDEKTLDMFASNPLGIGMDLLFSQVVIPKIFGSAVEELEQAYSSFMPLVLNKIADMGDEIATDLFGQAKKIFGQTFGVRVEKEKKIKGAKVERGPIPFDGETKHAITEIITKELREQTSYLKAIAKNQGIDTKAARMNADVWDYNNNRYIKVSDVRKNIVDEIQNAFSDAFNNSKFGEQLRAQILGSFSDEKDQKSIQKTMNNILHVASSEKRHIEIGGDVWKEITNKVTKANPNAKGNVDKINKLLTQMASENPTVFMDFTNALLNSTNEYNKAVKRIGANATSYNLHASGLNGLDLDPIIAEMMGYAGAESVKDQGNENKIKRQKREGKGRIGKAASRGVRDVTGFMAGFATGNTTRMKEESKNFIKDIGGEMVGSIGDFVIEPIKEAIFGKESKGESLTDLIKNRVGDIKNTIMVKLFGDKNAEKEKDKRGAATALVENFKEGSNKWLTAIFGKEIASDDDRKKLQEEVTTKVKSMAPRGATGAAIGSGIGILAGHSILGTLMGGPAGAIMGLTAGILSRSEKFKEYVFGHEQEDGSKLGGLISDKTQKFVKDNKIKLAAGGIGGMLASGSIAKAGGLLGTIVGGPITGALLGLGASIAVGSESFKEILFGSEKAGQKGLFKGVADAFTSHFKGRTSPNLDVDTGAALVGAGGGALTGALIGKLGIIGAAATPLGPIGGALAGLALSIGLQGRNFKTFLFGEDAVDKKTGEVVHKTGLVEKFGNIFSANIIKPLVHETSYLVKDLGLWLKHDVAYPLSFAAEGLAGMAGKITGAIVDKFERTAGGIADFFMEKGEALFINVTKMTGDALSFGASIVQKSIKATLGIPAKALQIGVAVATSKVTAAIDKVTGTIMGATNWVAEMAKNAVLDIKDMVAKKVKDAFKKMTAPFRFIGKKLLNGGRRLYSFANDSLDRKLKAFGLTPKTLDWDFSGEDQNASLSERVKRQREIRQKERITLKNERKRNKINDKNAKIIAKATKGRYGEDSREAREYLKQHDYRAYKRLNTEVETADAFKFKNSESDSVIDGKSDADLLKKKPSDLKGFDRLSYYLASIWDWLKGSELDEVHDEVRETNEAINDMDSDVGSDEDTYVNSDGETVRKKSSRKYNKKFKGPFGRVRAQLSDTKKSIGNFLRAKSEKASSLLSELSEDMFGGGSGSSRITRHNARGGGRGLGSIIGLLGAVPSLLGFGKGGDTNDKVSNIKDRAREKAESIKNRIRNMHAPQNVENQTASLDTVTSTLDSRDYNSRNPKMVARAKRKFAEQNLAEARERGTSRAEKEAQIEAEDAKNREKNAENAMIDQAETSKKHYDLFSSLFSKKGLITAGLLVMAPKIMKLLKWLADGKGKEFVTNLGKKIGQLLNVVNDFANGIAKDLLNTEKNKERTDGKSAGEAVTDEITNDKDAIDELKEGDVGDAALDFVTDKKGRAWSGTTSKSRFLVHALPNLFMNSKLGKATKFAVKAGKGLFKFGKKHIPNVAKRAKNFPGKLVDKYVGHKFDKLVDAGKVDEAEALLAKYTEKSGGGLKSKAGAVLEKGKGLVNKVTGKFANEATDDVMQAVVEEGVANEGILGKALDWIKTFISKVTTGASKKIGTEIGEEAGEGIFKKLKDLIFSNGTIKERLTAKLASFLGIEAGLAATVVGWVVKEGVWIALGAINGVTGAAKLFRVDNKYVDAKMRIFASIIGGFEGSTVGTVVDMVNEVVASVTGFDFVHRLATTLYKATSSKKKGAKLEAGQEAFHNEYLEYQNEEITKAYVKAQKEGTIDKSMTEEEFTEKVANGEIKVEYMSFQDYNSKKHQSLGGKITSGFIGILSKAKSAITGGKTKKQKPRKKTWGEKISNITQKFNPISVGISTVKKGWDAIPVSGGNGRGGGFGKGFLRRRRRGGFGDYDGGVFDYTGMTNTAVYEEIEELANRPVGPITLPMYYKSDSKTKTISKPKTKQRKVEIPNFNISTPGTPNLELLSGVPATTTQSTTTPSNANAGFSLYSQPQLTLPGIWGYNQDTSTSKSTGGKVSDNETVDNNETAASIGSSVVTKAIEMATKNSKKARKKELNKIIRKVENGDFSNGEERIKKLAEAGYNYADIQNAINERAGVKKRYDRKDYLTKDEKAQTIADESVKKALTPLGGPGNKESEKSPDATEAGIGGVIGTQVGQSLGDMVKNITKSSVKSAKKELKKTIADTESGDFGNGEERIKKLMDAGWNYALIQNKVNKHLGSSKRYKIEDFIPDKKTGMVSPEKKAAMDKINDRVMADLKLDPFQLTQLDPSLANITSDTATNANAGFSLYSQPQFTLPGIWGYNNPSQSVTNVSTNTGNTVKFAGGLASLIKKAGYDPEALNETPGAINLKSLKQNSNALEAYVRSHIPEYKNADSGVSSVTQANINNIGYGPFNNKGTPGAINLKASTYGFRELASDLDKDRSRYKNTPTSLVQTGDQGFVNMIGYGPHNLRGTPGAIDLRAPKYGFRNVASYLNAKRAQYKNTPTSLVPSGNQATINNIGYGPHNLRGTPGAIDLRAPKYGLNDLESMTRSNMPGYQNTASSAIPYGSQANINNIGYGPHNLRGTPGSINLNAPTYGLSDLESDARARIPGYRNASTSAIPYGSQANINNIGYGPFNTKGTPGLISLKAPTYGLTNLESDVSARIPGYRNTATSLIPGGLQANLNNIGYGPFNTKGTPSAINLKASTYGFKELASDLNKNRSKYKSTTTSLALGGGPSAINATNMTGVSSSPEDIAALYKKDKKRKNLQKEYEKKLREKVRQARVNAIPFGRYNDDNEREWKSGYRSSIRERAERERESIIRNIERQSEKVKERKKKYWGDDDEHDNVKSRRHGNQERRVKKDENEERVMKMYDRKPKASSDSAKKTTKSAAKTISSPIANLVKRVVNKATGTAHKSKGAHGRGGGFGAGGPGDASMFGIDPNMAGSDAAAQFDSFTTNRIERNSQNMSKRASEIFIKSQKLVSDSYMEAYDTLGKQSRDAIFNAVGTSTESTDENDKIKDNKVWVTPDGAFYRPNGKTYDLVNVLGNVVYDGVSPSDVDMLKRLGMVSETELNGVIKQDMGSMVRKATQSVSGSLKNLWTTVSSLLKRGTSVLGRVLNSQSITATPITTTASSAGSSLASTATNIATSAASSATSTDTSSDTTGGGAGKGFARLAKVGGGYGRIARYIAPKGRIKRALHGGRAGTTNLDYLSTVVELKKQIASKKKGYSQKSYIRDIKINGREMSIRTDCTGFVSAAVYYATGCSATKSCPPSSTWVSGSLDSSLAKVGFKRMNWPGWDGCQKGDIICRNGHCEIFWESSGHKVMNCGSSSSCNNPGPTKSSHSSYKCIYRPENPGTAISTNSDSTTDTTNTSSTSSTTTATPSAGSTSITTYNSNSILNNIADAYSQAGTAMSNYVLSGQKDTSEVKKAVAQPITSRGASGKGPRGGGKGPDGFTYYSQHDPKWENKSYNMGQDNATMGNTGCGPTAMAMVASKMTGQDINPMQAASLAKAGGYRDETGTNWDYMNNAANSYGFNSTEMENPTPGFVATQLAQGKPMILSGGGSGKGGFGTSPFGNNEHYVVATGINSDGKVNVLDPEGRATSGKYNIDDLTSDTNAAWSFDNGGGFGKRISTMKHKKRGGGFGLAPTCENFIKRLYEISNFVKSHPGKVGFNWSGAPSSWGAFKRIVESGKKSYMTCLVPISWVLKDMGLRKGSKWYVNRGQAGKFSDQDYCSAMRPYFERITKGGPVGMTVKKAVKTGNLKPGDILCYTDGDSMHIFAYTGDGTKMFDGAQSPNGYNKKGIIKDYGRRSRKLGQVLRWKVGANGAITNTSGSTDSTKTATAFPKYNLTDKQIHDAATLVTGEAGGENMEASLDEASQIANLSESKGRPKTGEGLMKTMHSSWYASSSWTRGAKSNAKKAVKQAIVEGKRTLPRYVVEHDSFPNDIKNAKSRGEYKFGDDVRNRFGSHYQFYKFFGQNSGHKGDISGYFKDLYKKYKDDVPWNVEGTGGQNGEGAPAGGDAGTGAGAAAVPEKQGVLDYLSSAFSNAGNVMANAAFTDFQVKDFSPLKPTGTITGAAVPDTTTTSSSTDSTSTDQSGTTTGNTTSTAKNGSYLQNVATKAKEVFGLISNLKAKHDWNGSPSLEKLKKTKKTTCVGSVAVTLQEAGMLPKGAFINHPDPSGGIKKLKKGSYTLHKPHKIYKNLPANLKQEGNVYVQDKNIEIAGPNGKIWSANNNKGHNYGKGGKNVLKSSGYPFNSDINYVISPKNDVGPGGAITATTNTKTTANKTKNTNTKTTNKKKNTKNGAKGGGFGARVSSSKLSDYTKTSSYTSESYSPLNNQKITETVNNYINSSGSSNIDAKTLRVIVALLSEIAGNTGVASSKLDYLKTMQGNTTIISGNNKNANQNSPKNITNNIEMKTRTSQSRNEQIARRLAAGN